jgi:hypothetical protein
MIRMFKKASATLMLAAVMAIGLSSCYSTNHVVGAGAQSGQSVSERQWYAAWGLVPLKEVDTKAMAGGAKDYNIKTEHTFADQFISFFTSAVTISCQTVTVTK